MEQIKGGNEQPQPASFMSNYEVLLDSLKVKNSVAKQDVLNKEENHIASSKGDQVLGKIRAAFEQVDAFGLRVQYLAKDEPVQSVYILTLSAFRFEMSKNNQDEKSPLKRPYFIEFGNPLRPFERNTFCNELEKMVQSQAKGAKIERGWFTICFTKQSSAASSSTNSPLEVDFLITYKVGPDE